MTDIRYAQKEDLPTLVEIYNYYIENHHSTFNTQKVSVDDRKDWFSRYHEIGPHRLLVAEEGKKILGYACSSIYRDHPAFSETVETSIYLASDSRGKGVGTKLYEALFERLKGERLHLAVVGIALPNEPSIQLHKKLGFEEVGVFKEYAKVNGQYFSSVWMQKRLG
ncbi:MAG TPA: GNAT family N-acetyltransferase [Bdellovibrio sp.]|nr:GNAT family N-acetyltransferase [Bdellovibrio sp.]